MKPSKSLKQHGVADEIYKEILENLPTLHLG